MRKNFSVIHRVGASRTVINTDGRGGRISSPNTNDAPAQVDILTVGCSQAWGQAVPNSATFTSLLSKNLNKSAENLSVPGYGGVSALRRLQSNLDLRPNIVIYGFWEDHFRRNLTHCAAIQGPVCLELPTVVFDQSGKPSISPPNDAHRSIQLTRRYFIETATSTAEFRNFWTDFYWTGYGLWRELQRRVESATNTLLLGKSHEIAAAKLVLTQLKESSDTVNARLFVVFIPLYFQPTIEEPPTELIQFAKEQGIVFVNMTPPFRELRQAGTELAIPGDGHMTAEAHKAIAQEIEKLLR